MKWQKAIQFLDGFLADSAKQKPAITQILQLLRLGRTSESINGENKAWRTHFKVSNFFATFPVIAVLKMQPA